MMMAVVLKHNYVEPFPCASLNRLQNTRLIYLCARLDYECFDRHTVDITEKE